MPLQNGTTGDDFQFFNIVTEPAQSADLMAGRDVVFIRGSAFGQQIRVTFSSAGVGDGSPNDPAGTVNGDGGLAVRLQLEGAGDTLTGPVSRTDDEGITFISDTQGLTFDVRDLPSGVSRGNGFDIVTLGTAAGETLNALDPFRPTYINAGGGDDNITGGQRDDFLVGGAGNDELRGGAGNDGFLGGVGNDFFDGGSGNDLIDGGVGDDRLFGGTGNDSLEGGDGVDTLVGEEGDDNLNGGSGDDFIFGREGNDTSFTNLVTDGADRTDLGIGDDLAFIRTGGAGQIRITFNSAGVGDGSARDIVGGVGSDGLEAVRVQREDGTTDTLTGTVARFDDEGITFISDTAGATFDVRDLATGVSRGNAFTIVRLGTQAGEALNAIDPFRATYINAGGGNDNVTGGAMNDFLVGGAGDDEMRGLGGDDGFLLGDGNDYAEGGEGNDTIDGGDGNDRLYGGAGADTLIGGAGNDFLVGEGDNDTLTGGLGDDIIFGGEGIEIVNFNVLTDGFDRVDLGGGMDLVRVTGGATNVRLTFTSSEVGDGNGRDSNTMANQNGGGAVRFQNETAAGALTGIESQYDDEGITFISDTAGLTFDVRDTVFGFERGNLFEVVILGTLAGETLNSAQALRPYYINAGGGDDTVNGGFAADFLVGGNGNDNIFGSAGMDTLLGGAGNDRLEGAGDADTYTGGTGLDTFVFANTFGGLDTITDFVAVDDSLAFSAAAFNTTATLVSGGTPMATGAGATFLYNTTTGLLQYDADGTGAGAAISIVTLTGAPAITTADITFF